MAFETDQELQHRVFLLFSVKILYIELEKMHFLVHAPNSTEVLVLCYRLESDIGLNFGPKIEEIFLLEVHRLVVKQEKADFSCRIANGD